MPRIVELKDSSPLLIKPEDTVNGIVAVCRCGLSSNWPYCNGAHKATKGEDPAKLYHYDRELPQGTPRRHDVDASALQRFLAGKQPQGGPAESPVQAAGEAGQGHGAGATPARPPRPGPTHREQPEPAQARATEDAAPPKGPSQGI